MLAGPASTTPPVLRHLASFVAEDPLDADARTLATLRDGVIDTLGCIHAGADTDVAMKARRAVAAMGHGGSTQVIATDLQTARPQAAFLNAVAGHALDFDDWEIPGNTHPTVVLFPAMLAVCSDTASGAAFASAYLGGFEVIARLGEALNVRHYEAGWHSTMTLGTLGAAAAAGRMIGLNADAMTNALSIAASMATGFTCQFGSHAKPLQAGFAARGGVEAVLLASAGLTGRAHVLDHDRGLAALMGAVPRDRIAALPDRLGHGPALAEYGLVLKPWPSCGYTHRIMTCALRMRNRLDPRRIDRIDLHLPDFHAQVLPFDQPASRSEALFSLPFVTIMGLCRGGLTLADLADAPWADPDFRDLMQKVHVHAYAPARPDRNYADEDPDRMAVTTRDGDVIEETCVYPTGAPQAPLSDELLWQKFTANVGSGPADWIEKLCTWPSEADAANLFIRKGPRP